MSSRLGRCWRRSFQVRSTRASAPGSWRRRTAIRWPCSSSTGAGAPPTSPAGSLFRTRETCPGASKISTQLGLVCCQPRSSGWARSAAADPVGAPALILRAAQVRGLDTGIMDLAATVGLLEFGANVRFRHPLVRSAGYRAASPDDRRAVHEALAEVTDPLAAPDRRAWHRAHAAAGPDEAVAEELINSASRALRRRGAAAAAAVWERAVELTPDPRERAARALTAAEAKYAAGDFEAAQALLVTAEVGPSGELGEARVQRMRAQVAFALRRGGDAPPLMLRAAQRLQSLDAELARQTYLEALVAAI